MEAIIWRTPRRCPRSLPCRRSRRDGEERGAKGDEQPVLHAEHLVRTREKMNRMLSAYTGQPLEKIQIDTERDNFMSAEEAKAYGLIDEVIARR